MTPGPRSVLHGLARPGRVWRRVLVRGLRPRREVEPPFVALTFDDGPDPTFTPQVLQVLADHDARATFFLVGRQVRARPDIVRAVVAAGHVLGSHTYDHLPARGLSAREVERQVVDGRDAVEQVTGNPCTLFRPPRGELTLDLVRVVRRLRLETWLWTVDTKDYLVDTSTEDIIASALRVRAGGTLLLHDGLADSAPGSDPDRSRTVAALPAVLADLQKRGLHPRTC